MSTTADTRSPIAERFRDALMELENSSSVDALVELYADGCSLGSVASGERFDGLDGAREFWTTYRRQFGEVRSEFTLLVEDDAGAVLEWTTHATMDGSDVSYRGATVLEIEHGAVTRSMAYFDPSGLGRQLDESHADRSHAHASRPDATNADPGWSGPAPAEQSVPEAPTTEREPSGE